MTGLSVEVMADLDAPKRHNFITAWVKTREERMFGLPTEAFEDRPPLYSKESLRWYS
jgi:hypothetical protein